MPSDIVDQLMQAEQTRLSSLQTKRSQVSATQSAFSELKSKLLSFQSKAEEMQEESYFRPHTASTSDEDKLTVTASSDAVAAIHSVNVTQLATHDTHVSGAALTSVSDTLTADTSFVFSYNGTNYTASLQAGDTLATIAERIAALDYDDGDSTTTEGVSASVLYDGTNYRLVLQAMDSGTNSGASRIDVSGVNALAFDSGNSLANADWTNSVAGQDATMTVDGIAVTSDSNAASDVLSGLTLNLEATGSFTVTVANDSDTLKENIQGFIDSFNEIQSFISNNPDQFQGDSLARSTVAQIRNEFNTKTSSSTSPYGDLSTYTRAAEIGIRTNAKSGLLELDTSAFEEAVANGFNSIADLFTSTPDASNSSAFATAGANEGLAHRLEDLIDTLTQSGTDSSAFGGKNDALAARLASLDSSIDRETMRLEKVRDRLNKKFTSLEQLMSQMQATQSSLSQALG
ncbi:putative flagellar hook-associated 2 domain-containing protein [Magnetofaba australis IT-1]|uniref:Flagellar hook-associated protein 2 n=1 Tax=Magnetofaba australis IT-1 TaxID=1434232 RepID=A0A1Y2K6Z4_9PROT|nr:putative flagellar hook-associated 2 domain-containing protein [Magnetofaba australis IT-1]